MPSKKPTAKPKPAPAEAAGPASFTDLARERPGLVIGGGLLIGLLAGALMPRGTGRKIVRGAATAAALGSEVGLSLARQARDTAEDASGHLRDSAGKASESARRLGRGTAAAAGSASTTALDLARAGLTLLASLKR